MPAKIKKGESRDTLVSLRNSLATARQVLHDTTVQRDLLSERLSKTPMPVHPQAVAELTRSNTMLHAELTKAQELNASLTADMEAAGRCEVQLRTDLQMEKRRYYEFTTNLRRLLPVIPPIIPQTTAKNETHPEPSVLELVNNLVHEWKTIEEWRKRHDKLLEFKNFVHQTLDEAGVPKDPNPGETEETGCRIGTRLKWVFKMGTSKTSADAAERRAWRQVADAISAPAGADVLIYLKDKWNEVVKSRMEFNTLSSTIVQKDSIIHNAQETIRELTKALDEARAQADIEAKKSWGKVAEIIGANPGNAYDALCAFVVRHRQLQKQIERITFGSDREKAYPIATTRDHWAIAIFHGLMRGSKNGDNYRDKMILAYQHYDASVAVPTSDQAQTSA